MAAPGRSKAPRYDLMRDFQATPGGAPVDPTYIGTSPAWLIAIIPLGRPLTYSRDTHKSIGTVVEGAFTRRESPLLIHDDALAMSIITSKRSHTSSLSATLKHTGLNYLDKDVMLTGDWMLAWCFNNVEDLERVSEAVRRGQPANGFADGLKFVGRVHNIFRDVKVARSGAKHVVYQLSGVGFGELDSGFFYDTALATAANVSSDIRTFMAQIGLDFAKWAEQEQMKAGTIKDNAEILITALVDMILGKGVSSLVNRPLERAGSELQLSPQANKEAPYAYLIPRAVGTILGLEPADGTKAGVFGYADILQTVVGVQEFEPAATADTEGDGDFMPLLRDTSTFARKFCKEKLKGTFLPVNPSFVNVPLWNLLNQYLNPAINEMFTCLRVDEFGSIRPTLVARQIPFSTESIAERDDFKLSRFLAQPRWVVSPTMLVDGGSTVGRSDATRVNMVHVYGEYSVGASVRNTTNQLVRNPPIFDAVDIQRSGIRAIMRTVNCALHDTLAAPRAWMEAVADWSFGSQYTLGGHVDCVGIQSPIPVGDNIELEGMVYHIEQVAHRCSISGDGASTVKTFRTGLDVSNGMPVDQSDATADFPRYAGFRDHSTRREEDDEDSDREIGAGEAGLTTETVLLKR